LWPPATSTAKRQPCSTISTSVGSGDAASPGAQPAGRRGEPLALACRRVAALVQARRASLLQQRVGDRRLPALDARRQELHREEACVAVDDQPRQPVGLAMDEANAVARDRPARPRVDRGSDAAREEGGVDALAFLEAPRAQADRRQRAVRGPGEKASAVVLDAYRLAGIRLAAGDAAFEHPGMAAQQRALLAGTDADRLHAPILAGAAATALRSSCYFRRARGCAASYTFERWPKSSLV
jgi:hypothetical protein